MRPGGSSVFLSSLPGGDGPRAGSHTDLTVRKIAQRTRRNTQFSCANAAPCARNLPMFVHVARDVTAVSAHGSGSSSGRSLMPQRRPRSTPESRNPHRSGGRIGRDIMEPDDRNGGTDRRRRGAPVERGGRGHGLRPRVPRGDGDHAADGRRAGRGIRGTHLRALHGDARHPQALRRGHGREHRRCTAREGAARGPLGVRRAHLDRPAGRARGLRRQRPRPRAPRAPERPGVGRARRSRRGRTPTRSGSRTRHRRPRGSTSRASCGWGWRTTCSSTPACTSSS